MSGDNKPTAKHAAPKPEEKLTPEKELELLVPTEFPEDEFPDPAQDAEDLGKEDD